MKSNFLVLLLLFFVSLMGAAFLKGDFFPEATLIWNLWWGKVMVADLYIGFLLFTLFIFYVEGTFIKTLPWAMALMVLGNLVALAFLLTRRKKLVRLKETLK